jgi:crotonobetainyl-CoA:carnitine CoA-transferase CaiB-like acyl-CoA transferase
MDIGWGKVQNMDEMFRDLLFREQGMVMDVPD